MLTEKIKARGQNNSSDFKSRVPPFFLFLLQIIFNAISDSEYFQKKVWIKNNCITDLKMEKWIGRGGTFHSRN